MSASERHGMRDLRWLTLTIALLAAASSAAGLFWPGLYSETTPLAAMRGQDLVTFLVVPALLFAWRSIEHGSARAIPIWLGLLGYIAYTYTGAAFAYRFNALFIVYVALFSLSIATLLVSLERLDVADLEGKLSVIAPRGPVVAFLALLTLVLLESELGQILFAYAEGSLPPLLAMSDGAGNFVYVLDLGVVVPLSIVCAVGLRRRARGAALLAGALLVKSATMGLALLGMTWFQLAAGLPIDVPLTLAYGMIAGLAGLLSVWFLGHWHAWRIAPSARLDKWLPGAAFKDTIVVRSSASTAQLMEALCQVTLRDMPLAYWAGTLRYLPARLRSPTAARQARIELDQPFIGALTTGMGSIVLERAQDELVLGTIGKLHQLTDQEFADVQTPEQFIAFAEPNHEKLVISIRTVRDTDHTLIVLEHRTQPLDENAMRRFARYWLAIRPGGAFVTRQLLRAAVHRAERRWANANPTLGGADPV